MDVVAAERHGRAPELIADLTYSIDTGVTPVNESYGPGDLLRRDTGAVARWPMRIRDARPLAGELSLDRNGFVLVDHPTQVADFLDKDRLAEAYYPEIEALVAQVSGAARVVVFDYTLRSGDEGERAAQQIREPVQLVHNDYTERSGPRRVHEILPDEADALLQHRVAIIQVWRAIDQPIARDPLAVVDARSVAPADLIRSERRYTHRVGEIFRVSHNPAHDWYYFPRMRRDEALVFKVFDSEKDGRARFTPHTSFDDPATPPGAPPRQSIEARALAFF